MKTMLQTGQALNGQTVERLREHFKPSEVGPDGFPLDWSSDIVWRGMARVNTSKCYNVRLSVQGRQHFLTSAWSQHSAASLYDLALWKLCPKIGRKFVPNFPDDFDSICQLDVDAELPTLNELFASIPFLTAEDERLGEAALRARILNLEPSPSQMLKTRGNRQFVDVMFQVKKFRAAVESGMVDIQHSRSCLAALHKLPAIVELFQSAEASIREFVNTSKQIEELMEKSATYYSKLVAESESLGA